MNYTSILFWKLLTRYKLLIRESKALTTIIPLDAPTLVVTTIDLIGRSRESTLVLLILFLLEA